MFKSFKERIRDNELLSIQLIKSLVLISIFIEGYGFFSRVLGSNDANFYSTIAKHIVISGDWVNLYYAGSDWLDKPHFPFWLTALSYKIFGINSFAYIFPGYLFNLLGGYYTYKLGRYLYSYQVGLLSALFYFTSLHLMLSAIDVRAEAFLMGEIMPACYYWLKYNRQANYKSLLAASAFTALAMMSKGMVIIFPVYGGLAALWLYNREYKNFVSWKWVLAICLPFIFILPELICLFLQFDLHPEKIIFGHTGVSGVRFFFWDSQFGRFFDFGPYVSSGNEGYAHYFYFFHTILWAFLPWTMLFIVALYAAVKHLRMDNDNLQVKEQKLNLIYLTASFFIPFTLFSLTKFQLDHYTNIIIPFACILCSNWVYNYATRISRHWVFIFQIYLSFVLISLVLLFSFLIMPPTPLVKIFIFSLIVISLYLLFNRNRMLNRAIVYSCLAINLVYFFTQVVNDQVYIKYDAGYQAAELLNQQDREDVIDYLVNSSSLEFHLNLPYKRISDKNKLRLESTPYFLVTPVEVELDIPHAHLMGEFKSINQNQFISSLFNQDKLNNAIRKIAVWHVESRAIESYINK